MSLGAKLQLRQAQSLVMTPQLMQSIRLLQLTRMELERYIDEEIERNPLLERGRDGEEEVVEAAPREPEPAATDWFRDDATGLNAGDMAGGFDASLENIYPDEPGTVQPLAPDLGASWKSATSVSGAHQSDGFDLEDFAAAVPTLRDHVAEQIAFAFPDASRRMIAVELADWLDDAGYFQGEPSEIAARLGADEGTVLDVLSRCQTFDPPGLFARTLSECLAIQLRARDRLDPAMQTLLSHLDLLARRDFPVLRRLCGVDDEDLVAMAAEIRALDPRPGTAFQRGSADTIVPDVIVGAAADGGWSVELNPDALPKVLVDQAYYAEVSRRTRDKAGREFLSDCLQNANWLVRSLDQRARTILKVASEIVRQQDAFLVSGVRHLKPLSLRMVAEAIGMHESTVSRVTANKYVLTPRGVFELRYFFTAAIAGAGDGEAHSSAAVRDRIRELIDSEPPKAVLSDDAIVEILKKSGIDIARRTVAKYREGMSIPSSVQRRREKRAMVAAAGLR